MKKVLKVLLAFLLLVVLVLGGLIFYATLSDYKPNDEVLVLENEAATPLPDSLVYNFMIWNIGYAGLSADMDFFYDGGKNVRPDQQTVTKNLTAIGQFIQKQSDVDFWLFQEVDLDSKRSYATNQYDSISNYLTGFTSAFGKNYDVFFVPLPPSEPMGRVKSGLATYSKFIPANAVRYSFPGNYAWPKGLFMLDRCFLVNRYPLSNGKDLLVVNTHNSAYDDGSLRQQQMDYLKKVLLPEYEAGNYIIVGGDWNQCPPNFEPNFANNLMDNEERSDISADYLSTWNWAFQNKIPTNRRVKAPYDAQTTLTTVIDFYLLSPNIELLAVEGINLDFQNSDHQPVKMSLKLKKSDEL